MRRRRSLGGGFSPLKLFTSGVTGAWYDPSDYSTLFQDSAGVTPVTAVEQSVGLMLDKSQGLVLGSELVTNGDFSSGITGWSVYPGLATDTFEVVGGELHIANDGSTRGLSGTATGVGPSVVAGVTYKVTFTLRVVAATGVTSIQLNQNYHATARLSITGNIAANFGVGTHQITRYYTATNTELLTFSVDSSVGAVCDLYFDNVSVKAIAGNHALQATAGSRPTLSARYNILLATETLATQSVTTVATTYKLSFTGAGSITLSGTATGTYSAGTNTITCTAGSLTLTVAGSVTQADLRPSVTPTSMPAYQRVTTATDYATTGFLPYLAFDGTADFLGAPYVQSAYPVTLAAGVNNMTSVGGGNGIASVAQADTIYSAMRDGGTSNTDSTGRNAANLATSSIAVSGNKFCLSQFETSVFSHQVNGGTAVTVTNTNAFGTSVNIFVGKMRPAGNFSPARNYGVVITNTVLTAAQKNSLKNWMGNKMGVTL